MEQEAGVGQDVTVFLVGGDIDQRPGAGHPAGAQHADARLDELDHVVDHVAGFHMAAGGRDDHGDGIIAGLGQGKEIDADALGQGVADFAGDHDDARVEIMLVDLAGILDAAGGLFLLHRRGGRAERCRNSELSFWVSLILREDSDRYRDWRADCHPMQAPAQFVPIVIPAKRIPASMIAG